MAGAPRRAWLLAIAAVAVVLLRLLTFRSGVPRLEPTLSGLIGGVVGGAQVLIGALLLAARPPDRPAPLVVRGFVLVAVVQVVAVAAFVAVNLVSRGPGSGAVTYAFALLVSPAISATAAVGVAVAAIGMTTGPDGRSKGGAAVGVIAVAVWLGLAAASILQYLLAYAMPRPILIGQIATTAVVIAAMLAIAVLGARRGRRSGFRPLAIGGTVVAIGGVVGTALAQMLAANTSLARLDWIGIALGVATAATIAGWLLIVVAAWRGLPAEPAGVGSGATGAARP